MNYEGLQVKAIEAAKQFLIRHGYTVNDSKEAQEALKETGAQLIAIDGDEKYGPVVIVYVKAATEDMPETKVTRNEAEKDAFVIMTKKVMKLGEIRFDEICMHVNGDMALLKHHINMFGSDDEEAKVVRSE